MTASIHFMNGMYAVEHDSEFVAVASTYHAAEVIGLSMDEAKHSWAMGGDALMIEAGRFARAGGAAQLPLLAQCAAVFDSLLGGPVANGGILDELRRVRAALRKEGY